MFQKGLPARTFKDYKCEVEVATTIKNGCLEKPVAIVHEEGLSKV
jgi:hypothetical protein